MQELLDLCRTRLITVIDGERVLDLLRQLHIKVVCQANLHYLAPVRLISLAEHTFHGAVKLWQAADLMQHLLCGCEMLLDSKHDWWECVLIEEDDSFVIELRAE